MKIKTTLITLIGILLSINYAHAGIFWETLDEEKIEEIKFTSVINKSSKKILFNRPVYHNVVLVNPHTTIDTQGSTMFKLYKVYRKYSSLFGTKVQNAEDSFIIEVIEPTENVNFVLPHAVIAKKEITYSMFKLGMDVTIGPVNVKHNPEGIIEIVDK